MSCPLMNERSKPAFPGNVRCYVSLFVCAQINYAYFFAIVCGVILGARFDINGFCVNHPKLRMCKLTSDGKYIIVRKTCQRCGSAGLMTGEVNSQFSISSGDQGRWAISICTLNAVC